MAQHVSQIYTHNYGMIKLTIFRLLREPPFVASYMVGILNCGSWMSAVLSAEVQKGGLFLGSLISVLK